MFPTWLGWAGWERKTSWRRAIWLAETCELHDYRTMADSSLHAMETTPFRLSDKRRANRARVRFMARYQSATMNLEGHVTDLSADGLFFTSDFLDDLGEVARVWVQLPSRPDFIELRGEVRWVNDASHGGGMGLRLIDLGPAEREALSTLTDQVPDPVGRSPSGNA